MMEGMPHTVAQAARMAAAFWNQYFDVRRGIFVHTRAFLSMRKHFSRTHARWYFAVLLLFAASLRMLCAFTGNQAPFLLLSSDPLSSHPPSSLSREEKDLDLFICLAFGLIFILPD